MNATFKIKRILPAAGYPALHFLSIVTMWGRWDLNLELSIGNIRRCWATRLFGSFVFLIKNAFFLYLDLAWVLLFWYAFFWTCTLCRHGGQRRVSVFKPKKQVAARKGPNNLTHLTFSEGAKVVLHELFTQYPPDDEEVDKEKVGKKTERVDKMRRSKVDIFLKPLMSKAEIAKKVESLASKIERNSNLKQVFLTLWTQLKFYEYCWLDALCNFMVIILVMGSLTVKGFLDFVHAGNWRQV